MSAYEMGKMAYNSHKSLSSNPFEWSEYNGKVHEHTNWNDGWLAGFNEDRPAGHLFKMLASGGVSMETCLAAEARI